MKRYSLSVHVTHLERARHSSLVVLENEHPGGEWVRAADADATARTIQAELDDCRSTKEMYRKRVAELESRPDTEAVAAAKRATENARIDREFWYARAKSLEALLADAEHRLKVTEHALKHARDKAAAIVGRWQSVPK